MEEKREGGKEGRKEEGDGKGEKERGRRKEGEGKGEIQFYS